MKLTLEALFAHPDNKTVFRHMKVSGPEDVFYFEAITDGSPFDEGGQIFFHRYGRRVPDDARCTVNHHNLIAHERTARIFALHQGRFTIALRRDVSRFDGHYNGRLRGETLDGAVDLSLLGPPWVLFNWLDDEEDEDEPFWLAYELAGR